MSTPKTLQIFLPQGTPSGIRIAELTTRIVQAVACPRTGLDELFQRHESKHVATYFLLGGSDGDAKPEAYIGQTEDLVGRLKSHDANKEFWHTVVFWISRTHSFTQAHSGILKDDGTHLVFTEDTPFNSPSGAAMVVLGRTANGWLEWKNASGVPIDRIRKTAEQETAHE